MRQGESQVVRDFLRRASTRPAGILVDGEAGIGKTTFLLNVAEAAAAQDFRLLATGGAPTEARYAYAAVADLLDTVDRDVLADLPPVQRTALERVLLLAGDGPPTNERTVAAAFLSVLQHPTFDSPILITVDDAQWLDASSQVVFGYALRRLTGRVGVVATVRAGQPRRSEIPSWLKFARPDSTARIRLQPLALGGVHALISERLGHTLPRPIITRIHETSGGNPFFALELARAVAEEPSRGVVDLPDSLVALVRQRIGRPDEELSAVLLAASCARFPTIERVSRAVDLPPDRVVEIVESIGASDIVELDGNEIRFCHPLFASGVYTGASAPRRRAMHRRLAETVDEPELRARHLALAATTGDADTLEALDRAAEVTFAQGAPAVAAELIELAIKLGGDTPLRRIRAAEHHFRSGALDQAGARLQSTINRLEAGSTLRCVGLMLLAAIVGHDESMAAAVAALTQAVEEAEDPVLQLQGRLLVTPATGLIGRMAESVEQARLSVEEAERLGVDELLSQALTMWVTVTFLQGLGYDRASMHRALELETPSGWAGATFQASAIAPVVDGWAGNLVTAREQMHQVQRRLLQEGTEVDILWAAHHATMMDLWLGRYRDAAATADDAVQRAEQFGGKHMLTSSWTGRAAVAAYTGHQDEARTAARSAVDAARAIGTEFLVAPAVATLGFLEVSLGLYTEALTALGPLLASFDPVHGTEMVVGGHLPDAIEALTALGRIDEAEPLVAALESNGVRHDRPWMLAMGARGRSHLLAAGGDLDAADDVAQEALRHHQRLPMPFELARTQLLLGQVQRRRRRKQAAETTLCVALETFDRLGAPLWARRTRIELERLNVPVADGHGLTPAERRVAELAASGMSNKQIAAELFIAPKTVEMNLSSVYRKLGIRSRGGLAGALNTGDSQGKH